METQVAFRCDAPAHQGGDAGPDKLTIHQGQWAYCAFDARAEGHTWKPTGGSTLSALRQASLIKQSEHSRDPGGAA